jgi:HrpA-like RNA helicase
MLSVENVFYQMTNLDSKNPKDKFKLKAIKKRKRFNSQHSDHLALLNVFTDFLKMSGRQQAEFCNEYLLNHKSIQKAVLIWNQLKGYMS